MLSAVAVLRAVITAIAFVDVVGVGVDVGVYTYIYIYIYIYIYRERERERDVYYIMNRERDVTVPSPRALLPPTVKSAANSARES